MTTGSKGSTKALSASSTLESASSTKVQGDPGASSSVSSERQFFVTSGSGFTAKKCYKRNGSLNVLILFITEVLLGVMAISPTKGGAFRDV